jgi:hypothetical protein
MADDLEAIKGWVASWVDYELRLKGHIFRRMALSALTSTPLDPEGDNDDDRLDELLEGLDLSPFLGDVVSQVFRGKVDPDVHAVLCGFAALYLRNGKQMPRELAFYIGRNLLKEFHRPPSCKRGGTRYSLMARDHLIYLLVGRLERLGLNRSRGRYRSRNSRSVDRECAYSMAAKILTDAGIPTTERAVEEAYANFVSVGPLSRTNSRFRPG